MEVSTERAWCVCFGVFMYRLLWKLELIKYTVWKIVKGKCQKFRVYVCIDFILKCDYLNITMVYVCFILSLNISCTMPVLACQRNKTVTPNMKELTI